jgi:IclR family acetate operon transcriptional repressor
MLGNTPSRQINSVRTAFELLNRLQALGGATSAQLAEELPLSRSSVHNYLATLEMDGYVVNDGGTYRLGLRFLTHGEAAKSMIRVESPVVETLEAVAEEVSQPTWYVTEEYGRGYFVENAVPEAASPLYGSVGKRSYLHTHAPGKAILALAGDEYVERIAEHHGLPEQTHNTTTDLNELRTDLADVRERGFAVSEGEAILGIMSAGAGYRDSGDRLHAIGVFGHSRNFVGDRAEGIGRRLARVVDDMQQRLRSGGS